MIFLKTNVNLIVLTSLKCVEILQLARSKTLLHSLFSFSSHLKSVGNRSVDTHIAPHSFQYCRIPLAGTHRTSYRRKVEENPTLLLELWVEENPRLLLEQSSKLSTLTRYELYLSLLLFLVMRWHCPKVLIKLLSHFVHLANHIKVSIRIVMWGFILLWQLIVLYVVFKLDESYTPSKVSIRAGDGFHNLKEIKTVELVKPTGWVYLSLSGADPSIHLGLASKSIYPPSVAESVAVIIPQGNCLPFEFRSQIGASSKLASIPNHCRSSKHHMKFANNTRKQI
ncbi:Anaphase-promoting complex subunit 10 [Glycine soja]